jgi:hypothetical protein
MPADFPARENCCRCFVQRSAEHFYVYSVPFTDEPHFGIDGIVNIHNQHQWAEVLSILGTSSSSALMCRQELLVIVW